VACADDEELDAITVLKWARFLLLPLANPRFIRERLVFLAGKTRVLLKTVGSQPLVALLRVPGLEVGGVGHSHLCSFSDPSQKETLNK
jgi:hypothetical protein